MKKKIIVLLVTALTMTMIGCSGNLDFLKQNEEEIEEENDGEDGDNRDEDEDDQHDDEKLDDVEESVSDTETASESEEAQGLSDSDKKKIELSEETVEMLEFYGGLFDIKAEERTVVLSELDMEKKESMVFAMLNHGVYLMDLNEICKHESGEYNNYVAKSELDAILEQQLDCSFTDVKPTDRYCMFRDGNYHIKNVYEDVGIGVDVLQSYEYGDGTIEIYASLEDNMYMEFMSCHDKAQLMKFTAKKEDNPWGMKLTQLTYEGDNGTGYCSLETSSFYSDKYGDYVGKNLTDNDNRTTWVPGGTNAGVGESISITTDPTKPIFAVYIANGYLKSIDSYNNNGKVTKISAYTYEESQSFDLPVMDFSDIYEEDNPLFTDRLVFDEPLYTTQLILTLDATTPGAKYSDICVSDIYVLTSKEQIIPCDR